MEPKVHRYIAEEKARVGGQRSRNLSRKGFTARHYITCVGQVLKSVVTMASDVATKLQSQIATKFKPSHPSLTVMYTSNAWENDLSSGRYIPSAGPSACRTTPECPA